MNKSSPPETVSKSFNIHEKLKVAKTHWSYCFAAQPHDQTFNYQFRTSWVKGIEFAIYERTGEYYVLVDFFKSYEEACDDAKKIIDAYPEIKRMFASS